MPKRARVQIKRGIYMVPGLGGDSTVRVINEGVIG
jgi:hypothetical protein